MQPSLLFDTMPQDAPPAPCHCDAKPVNILRHGAWRGEYHEDGEYIADVAAQIAVLGRFRDTPVMVRDGNAVGYGIQETIYQGVYPELGLEADTDYPIA